MSDLDLLLAPPEKTFAFKTLFQASCGGTHSDSWVLMDWCGDNTPQAQVTQAWDILKDDAH